MKPVLTTALNARGAPGVRPRRVRAALRSEERSRGERSIHISSMKITVGCGIGDSSIGMKRELFFQSPEQDLSSAWMVRSLFRPQSSQGLGTGVTTFGTFAAYGQLLPANFFFPIARRSRVAGAQPKLYRDLSSGIPSRQSHGQNQDSAAMWSPMVEFLRKQGSCDRGEHGLGCCAAVSGNAQQAANIYGRMWSTDSRDQYGADRDAGNCFISCGTGRTAS